MAVMADKVPFPFMSSTDIMDYMVERMLYRFHGAGKGDGPDDLDKRIEEAYRQRYGCDMLQGQKVENVCLHGLPGVGKTSAVRAAAEEVAKILGMRFVSNPVPPYLPQPNDLVVSTLEMSGEVSNIVMGGIPTADKIEKPEDINNPLKYMNKLPLYQLAIMSQSRAPVLLLDDFANAAPPVQNSALSIALEGRFQMLDLGSPFVAMTANLGSLDNSDVSPLSDPMMGRIGHFYVEDSLEDFTKRAQARYQDGLADANVIGFLAVNDNYFMLPVDDDKRAMKNGVRTPYPSPRTWDKLMNEMRISTNSMMSKGGSEVSTSKISQLAAAYVGPHAGAAYGAYVYEVLTGAELISRKLIDKGEFDEDLFNKRYADSHSDSSNRFGIQLAFSLSAHAAAAIKKNPDNLEQIMLRFGNGLMRLSDPIVMMGVNDISSRVTQHATDGLVEKTSKNDGILTSKAVTTMLVALVKAAKDVGNPADMDFSKSLSEAISGVQAYRNTYQSGKANKKPGAR